MPAPTTALAFGRATHGEVRRRYGYLLLQAKATEFAADENIEERQQLPLPPGDKEAEAERLRREVFANETGFLASTKFNPTRAREKEEEEELERLAAEWGSSPERAKAALEKTKAGNGSSFQELDALAEEFNMSDDQQRAFMLKASMKDLSSITSLPRKAPRSLANEAVNERVFSAEKGFSKNSKSFKSKMKEGSGVRFDSQGFPITDGADPLIDAARRSKPTEISGVEGVTFPILHDCPRCSSPAMEDELSRFGMCSQCKAEDISAKAYSGPPVASKYTYDNGDAPFSSSWTPPLPPARRNTPDQPPAQPRTRGRNTSLPAGATGNAPPHPRKAPSTGDAPEPLRRPLTPRADRTESRVRPGPPAAAKATAATAAGTGAALNPAAAGASPAASSPALPVRAAVPTRAAVEGRAVGGIEVKRVGDGDGDGGAAATRKLSLEVAELRSLLENTRGALRKLGVGRGGGDVPPGNKDSEKRDAALRKLNREVSELRLELSTAADAARVAGGAVAKGGDTEAVQKLSREVTELRSQLGSARKDQAMTRTALRRLQNEVDDLNDRVAQ